MNPQERGRIEGLFQRPQQAEAPSGPRDADNRAGRCGPLRLHHMHRLLTVLGPAYLDRSVGHGSIDCWPNACESMGVISAGPDVAIDAVYPRHAGPSAPGPCCLP